ncbi:MAG TPA: cysteine-rich CWC family protein [Vicinamibacterales bacterium]
MSTLRRILGYVSLRWKDPQACAACGGDFICGATVTGCWCTQVKLNADTRASLRGRYKNCLCRSCLEREAAREGV